MLAKVIKTDHEGKSRGFKPAMDYVMRASEEERDKVAPGERFEAGHLNMDSYWHPQTELTDANARLGYARDLALQCESTEAACRARPASRFRGNPVYHVAINWIEGEHPTREQALRACRHVMQALGCADHQAAWAIHRDTDNDHVHLVVNRVHPERLTVWYPPFRKDYFILDKCMRELEIEFGHGRANGPWITLDTEHGPEIVRMSRAERCARGLLKESAPGAVRLTDGATRAEKHLGAGVSFQSWVAGAPARDLKAVIEQRGATWQDAHAALARCGVRIETKGSGMVVTSTMSDGRVLAAKASQLGRWASKMELERRLGPFEPPDPGLPRSPPDPRKTYEAALEAVITDVDRDQPPLGADERTDEHLREAEGGVSRGHRDSGREDKSGDRREESRGSKTRDPNRRAEQRAERARAREQLRVTFKKDQAELRARRRTLRTELALRNKAERNALFSALRAERIATRRAARAGLRGPAADQAVNMALARWAQLAAQRKEELQKRHITERTALKALPPEQAWRNWLIERAAAGDVAAEGALRGFRYRERRKAKRDALEGDDPAALAPRLTVAALTADVDQRRGLIIYRGTDGAEKFVDFGQRIEMRDRQVDSLEAALRIAAEKYGGRVSIQGSSEFRERAARLAARLGVRVSDEDLRSIVTDERARIEQEWRSPSVAARDRERARAGERLEDGPHDNEQSRDEEKDLGR